MTAGRVAVIVAALVLLAGRLVWRAVVPAPLTAADVRARLQGSSRIRSPRDRARTGRPTLATIVEVVAGGVVGRLVERNLGTALQYAGVRVVDVVSRMLTVAAITWLTVLVTLALVFAGGIARPGPTWLLVLFAPPLVLAFQQIGAVRAVAAERRAELRRSVTDFTQLVAVALTTNRSVEEAVTFAAEIGEGFGFDLLRRAVDEAPIRGEPVWSAMADLAEAYDVDELRNVAGSIQQQAELGASVTETIRAEARSLRDKQLGAVTEAADRANQNLSLPTLGMVVGMVLFLTYPVMVSVAEAFSR